MLRPCHLLATLALSTVLLAPAASAQGGYRKQDFRRYGLEDLPVPKRWDAVPVQPIEEHVVLKWAEELPDEDDRRERRERRPTLDRVRLDLTKVEQPDEERTTSDADDGPLDSVQRYLRQEVAGTWKQVGSTEQLDDEAGRQRLVRTFQDEGRGGRARSGVAWVFEWRRPGELQFFVGRCAEADLDELEDIWRYMATRVDLVEPVEPDLSKWERHYERTRAARSRCASCCTPRSRSSTPRLRSTTPRPGRSCTSCAARARWSSTRSGRGSTRPTTTR